MQAPTATIAARLAGTLEQALPPELTGSAHSWFSRYRRYPVFSMAWARGRTRTFGAAAALLLVAVCVPMFFSPLDELPLGGLVQISVQIFFPLVAGPFLGAWVRHQTWPPEREWRALVLAVVAVVLATLAFHQWAAEPTKQWLAERTGNVDENGRRRKIAMSIGVVVTPVPSTSAPARLPDEPQPIHRVTNAVSSVLLSFCLGGGLALWGWRREQAALAALAQQRELARAQAQRREAELRLSVLAAQVEPHFLFNTLAGVRSAIATDPERASEMIDTLVDYLRATIPRLRSDGSAESTVGAQFEAVRAYLGLMSARMPRLAVNVQAPPELLQARCPPLMLISLAENAVKHGVELKVGPAQIQVRAERTTGGELALTVEDDGVGFGHTPGSGHAGNGLGLTNVRERLAQLYGDRAALTLRSRPQGGVAATLTLPLDLVA